jgi:hypothetical protein
MALKISGFKIYIIHIQVANTDTNETPIMIHRKRPFTNERKTIHPGCAVAVGAFSECNQVVLPLHSGFGWPKPNAVVSHQSV